MMLVNMKMLMNTRVFVIVKGKENQDIVLFKDS
jgi:hypothetical protein